jgi:integrase/recombinase XerD
MTFQPMTFQEYLTQTKKYRVTTAKNYFKYATAFLLYLENEGITTEQLTYKNLITFIEYRKKQGHPKRHINAQLSAIKHYLDYLVEKEILPCNVGNGLFIRGRQSTVPSGLLSGEELRQLYEKYTIKTDNKQHYPSMVRNKVITGLMVFQGLLPDEMRMLKVSDIDLQKATITVQASKRSEKRTLSLEAIQLFNLQKYLSESKVTDLLFAGNVSNFVFNLFKHLKHINPLAKTAMQLKMSLLTELLKVKDLREVQDFAGHRFVSSTERYQTSHLQSLQNDLTKFHPLQHSDSGKE